MWIVSTLVLAFILRVFELPYEQNAEVSSVLLRDFGSAIWLSVITMTTVGYGDICPKTTGGRFTAMFIAIWGSFVISLLIMVTADIFEFHPKEQQAVFYIKEQRTAAKAIVKAMKFFISKRNYYVKKLENNPNLVNESTFIKMIWNQRDNLDEYRRLKNKNKDTLFDHIANAQQKHTQSKGNSLQALLNKQL